MEAESILIVGSNGQLGKALKYFYPKAVAVDSNELDITDSGAVMGYDWSKIKYILNAAAYTNVDGAETNEGRRIAWNVNSVAPLNLVRVAEKNNICLVHISSDYVFDGTVDSHKEDEPYSPISTYGATKAAGDIVISSYPKHYILRTSWVIGEGRNFVRTMLDLGKKGVNPSVVSDQIGRPTFTSELVSAIDYLLTKKSASGIYNLSNDGDVVSWADIARKTFEVAGFDNIVTNITTKEYYDGESGIAPRPLNSSLDLSNIKATGFKPSDWKQEIVNYIRKELNR